MARCSTYNLITYLEGVAIKKDTGCVGYSHTYTTSTTLPGTVTYKWYLDSVIPPSPVLSTEGDFTYTFDGNDHDLYVIARSSSTNCSIQVGIAIDGVVCNDPCGIDCLKETVNVKPGIFDRLTDNFGNTILVPPGISITCAPGSSQNTQAEKWLKAYLKSQPNCSNSNIKVNISYNKGSNQCATITIVNSPIKFVTTTVGSTTYNFNTTNC
jgi:hypothetical protein